MDDLTSAFAQSSVVGTIPTTLLTGREREVAKLVRARLDELPKGWAMEDAVAIMEEIAPDLSRQSKQKVAAELYQEVKIRKTQELIDLKNRQITTKLVDLAPGFAELPDEKKAKFIKAGFNSDDEIVSDMRAGIQAAQRLMPQRINAPVQKPEARQVEIIEPVGSGLYRQFRDEMQAFRAFHITTDQYNGWFMPQDHEDMNDGKARLLSFTLPFHQFCLVPDPEWIDLAGSPLSPYMQERAKEKPDIVRDTKVNKYRPEGITVKYDGSIVQFTSSYHVANDRYDRHIVTSGFLALGDENDPLPGPRNVHISRHVLIDGDQHFQQFIDGLAYLNHLVVLRFLHTLNHRKVRVIDIQDDPFKPPTRQQRRAENWKEREHYKVYIPATMSVRQINEQIFKGGNRYVHEVQGHERRSHLRKDKYGRKRIQVKGKGPNGAIQVKGGFKGKYFPIYSAHNVGMEGIED